jgi:glycosyltransferase involved in cell wall biosynthesis
LFRDVYGEIETNNCRAVVYNGIQDYFLSQKNSHAEHIDDITMRVVVVGNYYYSKGIDLVMSIVNDTPDIEYHLFGNVFSGLSKQKRLKLQKKIKKNVITHGKVERKVFTKFLTDNKCVVCIPSRTEVCSLVAIEALVSSHPMVVSDIPVFHEIINEDVAMIFDLDVIESLKSSLRLAFVNYNRLSNGARKLFLNKYTVEKMSKQYEYYYREMLL